MNKILSKFPVQSAFLLINKLEVYEFDKDETEDNTYKGSFCLFFFIKLINFIYIYWLRLFFMKEKKWCHKVRKY